MGRQLKWRIRGAASAALAIAGALIAGTMPAQATVAAAPTASSATTAAPTETGNLLDYANSDFEGTTGNWKSVSNATLTDDASEAYLHHHSLLDTVPAAGPSKFEVHQGSAAAPIRVGAGDTYTVGAYFKIPAVTGQSLAFGLGFPVSSGTLITIKWVSTGRLRLAGTGQWQYVSGQITAPAGATSVISSPRVTYYGASAGQAINMDEAAFVPQRAAQIIGAYLPNATDWIAADKLGDVGPLQSIKQFRFNEKLLPTRWRRTGNACYEIEKGLGQENSARWPACLITYGVRETEPELVKFFTGLPAQQMVIMNWKQEPEFREHVFPSCGGHTGDGKAYVCDFKIESDNIRKAAGDRPNVFVSMDAGTREYATGTKHDRGGAAPNCPFIPPASYVDFYLADHYDENATGAGASLPDEKAPGGTEWSTWLGCVASSGKPIGVAEYGLDCKTQNPPQQTLAGEIGKDKGYLAAIPGARQPTIMWEYWDWDTNPPGCAMTSTTVKDAWKSAETQNGGG